MPRVKISRADRNPWLAKMLCRIFIQFVCKGVDFKYISIVKNFSMVFTNINKKLN